MPELAGSCSRKNGAEQAGSSMAGAETVLTFVGCTPTATETVEAGNDDLVSSHWATDGARGDGRAAQGAGRGEARSYLEPGRRKRWLRTGNPDPLPPGEPRRETGRRRRSKRQGLPGVALV